MTAKKAKWTDAPVNRDASEKVLAKPGILANLLSFNAYDPPVSAESISHAGSRQNPSKDACALFFSGAGSDLQPPISLCSYIGDEKTEVFDTSSVKISAGLVCQVPVADEFPERFCANLAFSMMRILREFAKRRFHTTYEERVGLSLNFTSGLNIRYHSSYKLSGHQINYISFGFFDERGVMAFQGEYGESSPTAYALRRQHINYGVPNSYPQSYEQRQLSFSRLSAPDLLAIFQSNCASGHAMATKEFTISTHMQNEQRNKTYAVLKDPLELCLKALKKKSDPFALVAKSWGDARTLSAE
jgi:hypothetical protein